MKKLSNKEFVAEVWRAWYELGEKHRAGNGKVVADAAVADLLRRRPHLADETPAA